MANALTVRIDVDGNTVGTTTANLARPDLVTFFGSANHGYTFNLPATLAPGFHRVEVYALDSSTAAPALLGSRTINTNFAPLGSIDVADENLLAGWAFDPNAGNAPTSILFQIDNFAPQVATANVARADLTPSLGSANHGFAIPLPRLAGGVHTVTVWALDTTTLAPTGLAQRAFFSTSNTRGSLDLATPTVVAGWAWDPERAATSQPTLIRVDVDGQPGTPFATGLARPDLAALGTVGYAQALSDLSPGQHRIDVFAYDAPSDAPTLLGSRLLTVRMSDSRPGGSLDVANGNTLAGWAFDPAREGGTAIVRLDIQGQPALLLTANAARNDLAGPLGSPNHGFSVNMPKLGAGTYQVTMSLLNPLTFSLVPVVTKMVTIA